MPSLTHSRNLLISSTLAFKNPATAALFSLYADIAAMLFASEPPGIGIDCISLLALKRLISWNTFHSRKLHYDA